MRYLAAFVVIPGMVVAFALCLFAFDPGAHDVATDGKAVYEARCMSCHQANGAGMPGVFPTLHNTPWVVGSPERLIAIVLNGLMGELTVEGVTYNGAMPAWGGMLSDEEISAVLTFVRSSWGNQAPAISDSTVAGVRATLADRSTPWTPGDLDSQFGSDDGLPDNGTADAGEPGE